MPTRSLPKSWEAARVIPPPDEQRVACGFLHPDEHQAFQRGLLARIFETTEAAWKQIIARGQVVSSDDENTMSDRLSEQINAEVDQSPQMATGSAPSGVCDGVRLLTRPRETSSWTS